MPQPDSPARRRRVMRAFKIDELSAVTRPAQVGARAVILKVADPILPSHEATPAEREAARLHNVRARDEAEREAAARAAEMPPMTLRDIDIKLESMADAARGKGETVEQAYRRLLIERDPAFVELLRHRDRVELSGPQGSEQERDPAARRSLH